VTRNEHYRCVIERDEDGRVAALTVQTTDLEGTERQVRVNGYRAIHLAAGFQEILRSAKLRGRDWTSGEPIVVKPLQRVDRITTVADGVAQMSREEAAYWHAQTSRRNGLRSLRLLLGEGSKR